MAFCGSSPVASSARTVGFPSFRRRIPRSAPFMHTFGTPSIPAYRHRGAPDPRMAHMVSTSVWRHQKAPHGGLSLDRLSNIVKDLLRECGVDTSVWTAATVRGATASTALAHGIPAAAVMDAGDWTSSIVFNAYYNRSGRSVNWVDVLTSALRMNSVSSGTADDRADISSMFSEVVSDICSKSCLQSCGFPNRSFRPLNRTLWQ